MKSSINNYKISVLLPCRNEAMYITTAIESILNQNFPMALIEFIVIDGNSTDTTLDIVKRYSEIKVIHNPREIVPISMNLGIQSCTGDYVMRIDAHSSFPPEYISTLLKYALEYDTDNIGCVAITRVVNDNHKSIAIQKVLSHKFGVGNSSFRTGVKTSMEVDTVPFGFFKRSVFQKYGMYDERLSRNQDLELNKRIKRGGGKIILIPYTYLEYYARETFTGLFRNNYHNGLWNILTIYYTNSITSLSIRHFIPLFYMLSLIIPSLLTAYVNKMFYISILVFLIHFLASYMVAVSIRGKGTTIAHMLIAFYVLHISYGLGSLIGLIKTIKMWLKNK